MNNLQTPRHFKVLQKIPQKYYLPSISTYIRNCVRGCEICIQDKRINNTRITPELIHIPEWDLGPEYLMQIDLLPELPPSGGYENIIKAIDVFSRYAFAYPVFNPTAVNTAKVIIDIMTRLAYLPTLIITDEGSVLVSRAIHELAEILGINLKNATTKHAQTTGVLERAHATGFFENGIRRLQETMAQIFTQCNPALQQHISFQNRL